MIIVGAAALGPATGVLIRAATAAAGFSRTVAGAAARPYSVCHSTRCMLLCRFALGVSALHENGIHGSSPFLLMCISISRHLKTTLSELNIDQIRLVPVSEFWSM